MKLLNGNYTCRALPAALAVALALAAAACDQKPSVQNAAGKAISPANQPADAAQAERSPDAKTVADAGAVPGDAALAAEVKSMLGTVPGLNAAGIDVKSTEGVVVLFGTTGSPGNRDKAAQVASSVPGVKSVRNELVVVSGS